MSKSENKLKLATALEKAQRYLNEVSERCERSNDKDMVGEGHSLRGVTQLLDMRIDSLKRMAEHDKRIEHLDKEIGSLQQSAAEGQNRIYKIAKEAEAMSKLNPADENFREELAKIEFDNPIMKEAVKAFAEGDDQKAFKDLSELFKPKH